MAKRTGKPGKHKQFAALPWCLNEKGEVVVLTLRSRDSWQWILSKGKMEAPLTGSQIAAMEAEEEAGVLGVVDEVPIGRFRYLKHQRSGDVLLCVVEVYLLRATEQLIEWKEKGQREIVWALPEAAIKRLLENTNIPEKKKNKQKLAALVRLGVKQVSALLAGTVPSKAEEPEKPKKRGSKPKELSAVPS